MVIENLGVAFGNVLERSKCTVLKNTFTYNAIHNGMFAKNFLDLSSDQ